MPHATSRSASHQRFPRPADIHRLSAALIMKTMHSAIPFARGLHVAMRLNRIPIVLQYLTSSPRNSVPRSTLRHTSTPNLHTNCSCKQLTTWNESRCAKIIYSSHLVKRSIAMTTAVPPFGAAGDSYTKQSRA